MTKEEKLKEIELRFMKTYLFVNNYRERIYTEGLAQSGDQTLKNYDDMFWTIETLKEALSEIELLKALVKSLNHFPHNKIAKLASEAAFEEGC